jgi:ABC-type polysaccharide/polyol phosphate export permease
MAVFLPIMLVATKAMPAVPMLAFPLVLLLQTVFTLGVALMLSSATAIYRDVKHLTEIGLSMLFWLTPVVYELSQIHSRSIQTIVGLTPLTPFISAYQTIFIDQAWPSGSTFAIAAVYAVTMLTAGATLFFSLEDRFAEQI